MTFPVKVLCRGASAVLVAALLSSVLYGQPATPAQSVGKYLDDNGRLNLPRSFTGNLDPTGYRLVIDKDGAPQFVSSVTSVPGDENWDDRFCFPGSADNGEVNAIAVTPGGTVYMGGRFSSIGGADSAFRIARYDPLNRHWYRMGTGFLGGGSGTSGVVYALAVNGEDVFAAGFYAPGGPQQVAKIAHWSASTSIWDSLGTGIGGTNPLILALAINGGYLYVGGRFSSAGGAPASNIARWSLTNSSWSALGSGVTGVNATVYALAPYGSGVIVGGHFTSAGPLNVSNIAQWDGSSWGGIGQGVNGDVYALCQGNTGTIYAGGNFTQATNGDATTVPAAGVALYNGSWSALGGGVTSAAGTPLVGALAYVSGTLYVGGSFLSAAGGSITAHSIAKYDGTWHPLGQGTNVNPSGVRALNYAQGRLYVGGDFGIVDSNLSAPSLCVWNDSTATWETVGWGIQGGVGFIYPYVNAVLVDGPTANVYVAGGFLLAGGLKGARSIARFNYDRNKWYVLEKGVHGTVNALAKYAGDIYVGGIFDSAGTFKVNGLARWNFILGTWEDPGAQLAAGSTVNAFAVYKSSLYVGGAFTSIGGVVSPGIGSYDGSTWSPVGRGIIGNQVLALATPPKDPYSLLYVGGDFAQVAQSNGDQVSVGNIARWDGAAWSCLNPNPNGVASTSGVVRAVLPYGSAVYVGGDFTSVLYTDATDFLFIVNASHVAAWIGEAWSEVAGGVDKGGPSNSTAKFLKLAGGYIYAGGKFSTAGGTAANNIAYTDGFSWYPMGNGTDVRAPGLEQPTANAFDQSGPNTFIGGNFTKAGSKISLGLARWSPPLPQSTWTKISSPDTTKQLSSVDASQAPKIIVSSQAGKVYESTDAGSNWVERAINTIENITRVSALGPSDWFATGDGGSLFHTTNEGQIWSAVPIGIGIPRLNDLYFTPNKTYGGICGNNGFLATTMDKTTWNGIPIGPNPLTPVKRKMISLHISNDGRQIHVVGERGGIYRSTDAGTNWLAISSGTSNNLNRITFGDTSNAMVAGDNGTLLRTTDGGQSFSQILSETVANLYDIVYLDPNTVLVGGDSYLAISTDGGQHFSKDDIRYSAIYGLSLVVGLFQKVSASSFTVFAAGDSGVVLRNHFATTAISHAGSTVANHFSLSQNYPNPFNPTTIISYQLPEASSVRLVVYDLVGREVTTLVDEKKPAGSYTVSFDGSRLASGVYFYRLKADDRVQTRKLVLMK
jgi:photosystem II stability/assembly factor-like uncharacterized protein